MQKISNQCCAMQSDDTLLGFVGCDMVSRQRSWTGNDLRRMKLVGDMLAHALQTEGRNQIQRYKMPDC